MTIPEILSRYKKITVVGISPNPDRPSYYVSKYMMEEGYEIFGVNPGQKEVIGRPCYPKLSDVPDELEIVAVFRASEYLSEIVDEILRLPKKPKVLWIQLGIQDQSAEERASHAGIAVIARYCLMVEHQAL